MDKYFLHIIFLLLLIPINTSGKKKTSDREPPKWINEIHRREMFPPKIFFVQFEQVNNVRRKDFEVKRDETVKLLQEKLSKQIQSFITTKSLLIQTESSSHGYNEFFTKETKIVSEVVFFDSRPLIWFDKRSRRLFVLYAVKKTDVGEKYRKLLESRLKALKHELDEYNPDISLSLLQNNINKFKKRIADLKSIERIIVASGIEIPEETAAMYSDINISINKLEGKLHSAAVEKRIRNAEELFADGKYEEALKAFRLLSVDLPEDIRVIRGIEESKKSIEQLYLYKINQAVNRSNFSEALGIFDRLFTILPETRTEHAAELYELEHKMFDYLTTELDFALKTENIPSIKDAFSELEDFKFIDPEKFIRYKEKVNKAVAKDLYRQAKSSYSQHGYYEAIAKIKEAMALDNSNSRYKDLYNSSKERIYRYNLRQLKATRHHILMFQFGGGIQTHKEYVNQLLDDKDSKVVWLPSFSAGLFAKYGIRSHVTAYGHDLSRSNLIGLQYTFIKPEWHFGKGDIPQKELSYWQEIEFVVGFATKWLFETGIANNRLSTSINIKDVNFYTASLTRRFYTHPVELTMQFKTYVSPDWDFYPVFKMGLFFDMNMIRKISRADKKRIKQEIDMVR